MVTGYPKEVESPSLEGFQRCVDESAAVTIKKKRYGKLLKDVMCLQYFENTAIF